VSGARSRMEGLLFGFGDAEGSGEAEDGVRSPEEIRDCKSDCRRVEARALVWWRISESF